ncbi:ribbon-helix-helix protein, CopG family [Ectothiorhodospiraceae bacterium 2226]|nr:ribbon-helix-helix protein, CopG family [Ectothiorhodospiraceae bacterium 2226]
MKRFSVSLDLDECEELRRIAAAHRQPLSLQYVIRCALQRFIDYHKGKQLLLPLDRK